jgi:hypothetical protein
MDKKYPDFALVGYPRGKKYPAANALFNVMIGLEEF